MLFHKVLNKLYRLLLNIVALVQHAFFILRCYLLFHNKTVAIVGNSADLLNLNLGAQIDQHDIVIRLNYANINIGNETIGHKTSIRFIGCTVLEAHLDWVKSVPQDVVIISTGKNIDILKGGFFSSKAALNHDCYFYDKKTPWKAFHWLDNLLNSDYGKLNLNKPPRTGLVVLYLLLRFGHTKLISVYGMSRTESDAMQYSYENNATKSYNKEKYLDFHCDMKHEVDALNQLIELGKVSYNTQFSSQI